MTNLILGALALGFLYLSRAKDESVAGSAQPEPLPPIKDESNTQMPYPGGNDGLATSPAPESNPVKTVLGVVATGVAVAKVAAPVVTGIVSAVSGAATPAAAGAATAAAAGGAEVAATAPAAGAAAVGAPVAIIAFPIVWGAFVAYLILTGGKTTLDKAPYATNDGVPIDRNRYQSFAASGYQNDYGGRLTKYWDSYDGWHYSTAWVYIPISALQEGKWLTQDLRMQFSSGVIITKDSRSSGADNETWWLENYPAPDGTIFVIDRPADVYSDVGGYFITNWVWDTASQQWVNAFEGPAWPTAGYA